MNGDIFQLKILGRGFELVAESIIKDFGSPYMNY
jgi:hypothetical protein